MITLRAQSQQKFRIVAGAGVSRVCTRKVTRSHAEVLRAVSSVNQEVPEQQDPGWA